jgi:hypothetical protein
MNIGEVRSTSSAEPAHRSWECSFGSLDRSGGFSSGTKAGTLIMFMRYVGYSVLSLPENNPHLRYLNPTNSGSSDNV